MGSAARYPSAILLRSVPCAVLLLAGSSVAAAQVYCGRGVFGEGVQFGTQPVLGSASNASSDMSVQGWPEVMSEELVADAAPSRLSSKAAVPSRVRRVRRRRPREPTRRSGGWAYASARWHRADGPGRQLPDSRPRWLSPVRRAAPHRRSEPDPWCRVAAKMTRHARTALCDQCFEAGTMQVLRLPARDGRIHGAPIRAGPPAARCR